VKLVEGRAEMIEHIPRQQRFCALVLLKNRDVRRASANPGSDPGRIVKR
jgi:hypothetical protein